MRRRERLSAPLQWRVRSTRVHGNLPLRHETSRTPSPTTHGRQPWQVLRFPLAPCLSILSDTKIGPAHLGEPVRFLWQYRIIQQEHSARDFLPIQGLKSAGILCVFQTFRTAESAKNIRRRPKRNYAVLPYITALLHRRRWTRSFFNCYYLLIGGTALSDVRSGC